MEGEREREIEKKRSEKFLIFIFNDLFCSMHSRWVEFEMMLQTTTATMATAAANKGRKFIKKTLKTKLNFLIVLVHLTVVAVLCTVSEFEIEF